MIAVLDWLDLALAIWLMAATVLILRPANGSRPLLLGLANSALFGLALTIGRLVISGPDWNIDSSPWRGIFGVLIFEWLAFKLWAIYAVYTGNRRPFLYMWHRSNTRRRVARVLKYLTNASDRPPSA